MSIREEEEHVELKCIKRGGGIGWSTSSRLTKNILTNKLTKQNILIEKDLLQSHIHLRGTS